MERSLQRDELADTLRREAQVWTRFVWSNDADGERHVRVLEVSIGHPPPTWSEHEWQYAQAIFRARVEPGASIADWILGRGESKDAETLSWPANHSRRASGAVGQSEMLEWPVDEWRTSFTTQLNTVVGELVPSTGPAFRSFDLGVANHLGNAGRSNWSPSSPELVVRRQDRTARITSVVVGLQGELDGIVEGDDLNGATLEVSGELPGVAKKLGAAETQTFRFDSDLPPLPWLALHRDGLMLDQRRQLQRLPPGVSGEWGVTWEPEPLLEDDSPFTAEEQERIRIAIISVKVAVTAQLGAGPTTNALGEALDDIAEKTARMGRLELRKYVYGAFVDLVVRDVVTWDHVRVVFNLLRGAIGITGLQLPALPS